MALQFPLTPNPNPKAPAEVSAIQANPGFGVHFTDHMAVATWKKSEGWVADGIVSYGPFSLDPAAAVFHYAQEIFEGMKAYKYPDGSIWTFRPEANAQRFNKSADRIMLPQIPIGDFVKAVDELVRVDARWVPESVGEKSLYLRPFMFASENFLGVRAAEEVIFSVIASPVAPYFATGVKPVDIWVTSEYARAGIGGTGFAKCGGNYAASLLAQYEGYEYGCDQVLYIEASNKDRVEEFGGMNLFIVTDDGQLVTPALTGTILDGITRRSILTVGEDLGLKVVERRVTPDELFTGINDGTIQEAFSCGTAAVITPVSGFKAKSDAGAINEFKLAQPSGETTVALRERLIDIQFGRVEDTHSWMHRII